MNSELTARSTRLLLVEDNPVDVQLLNYAILEQKTWSVVTTLAEDGEKAINILLAVAARQSEKPDFVILDLNLPKRDGAEVLRTIRTTQGLTDLPVAVLSSSPTDVVRGRLSQADVTANCYFTKPMDVDGFLDVAAQLHHCYQKHHA